MQIIYISGIDGCGKTTQATHLADRLRENNISADYQWLRWEPSIVYALKTLKNMFGKNYKSSINDISSNEKAESKWNGFKHKLMKSRLFRRIWISYASNDYYRSYKKARKKWNSDIIILDRYIFDFIADQSINFNISADEMAKQFSNSKVSKMQQPDFNIIIDISAETGFKRKMDGTSLLYLQQRENIYCHATGANLTHIDGNKSISDIHENIYNWICENVEF